MKNLGFIALGLFFALKTCNGQKVSDAVFPIDWFKLSYSDKYYGLYHKINVSSFKEYYPN